MKKINLRQILIFENEDFIVLDKPSGLLSVPDREGKEISLKLLLQKEYTEIFTVHRLDRETSGLIVFAKHENAHKYLSQQFENRQTVKIYNGLVKGIPRVKKDRLNLPIAASSSGKGLMTVNKNGKETITEYEVLEEFRICSWTRFRIHTGRTHQIRVHMQAIGHPLLCDPLYGDGKPFYVSDIKHNFRLSKDQEQEKPILSRLALHAAKLSFTFPGGSLQEFEAPFPKDIKATLQQLSKIKTQR